MHAGQQVELLETCNDWYLVRQIGKDDSSNQEGLIPPSCIKSSMKHSSSKISIENEGIIRFCAVTIVYSFNISHSLSFPF